MSVESACCLLNFSLPSNPCCSFFERGLGATTFTEEPEEPTTSAEEPTTSAEESTTTAEAEEVSEGAEESTTTAEEAEEAEEAANNSLYATVILSLNFSIFFNVHGTTLSFGGNFSFNIFAAA